jgi:DNA polymerase-3 subunit epsilon
VGGRLVGFDLETTGLDREVDQPISFAFCTFESRVAISVDAGWITPTCSISRDSSVVHGITTGRLAALGARSAEEAAAEIGVRVCTLSALGDPIVGTNLAFDLTIVDRSLGRLSCPTSLLAGGWYGPVLDVLVIDRAMDPDFDARPTRKLAALCEYYGVEVDLHTAAGDASAAVRVLLAQVARFPVLTEMSLAELHAQQIIWHKEWCEELSTRRVAEGDRPLQASESAWPYLERATLF